MVHIINGEIVPDDDPRVRARQQPQSSQQLSRRFGSVHTSGPDASPTARAPPPATGAPSLQGLARQIGLEGTVTIPGVLGLSPRPIPKIYLAVAALLTVFFGWRALVFIAFFLFLSAQQPAASRHT
ncbi:uncharacterized protein PHALS_10655 [Plasmopara halstedii]|uniref:DUF4605 domain-containing protein n=1 Tax=Plasmopara halstedii TaxID=4781 RepID=A0A0P1AH26_PLAHL|nr:uncharacterized protein PHALS_10655 [Plasmopara halstedii]CEG40458.1 hypothetical protein PHALS_10655 [Plasmopara halstedii]|eukprot:XP_024576827.1 hypothetical protein PHALS_10655 [Plasmopara halstedii]